jgi:hypothetical protein
MSIKDTNNLPLQMPPKFTQIGIFGLKINHLAAAETTEAKLRQASRPISRVNRLGEFSPIG